jgi:hypothetical protein
VCLPFTISARRARGTRLLLPGERRLSPLFDPALSDALDGRHTDGEALGDVRIRPRRAIGIGLQQAMGMPDLGGHRLPLPDQLGSWAAFLSRKTHDVLLVHGWLRLRVVRVSDSIITY